MEDLADDLGGGGGGAGGTLFEEVPINGFDWAKWLNMDDWFELGEMAANALADLLEKLDDWILNTFRPWALKWATRLATFINGFLISSTLNNCLKK